MIEKIQLITADNIPLSALHYKVELNNPGISLFHMMPSTKESYHRIIREEEGQLYIDFIEEEVKPARIFKLTAN